MASGWAGDNAVNEQIADSIADEVQRARDNLPKGESYIFCDECGEKIPEKRRLALPGVKLCIDCQNEKERSQKVLSLYNRRASKDSQLK